MSRTISDPTTAARTDKQSQPGGPPSAPKERPKKRRGDGKSGSALFSHGEPMVWLSGGSLALCMVMIVGLLALIVIQGAATFWPGKVVSVKLVDGSAVMGEIEREETYVLTGSRYSGLKDVEKDVLRPRMLEQIGQKVIADYQIVKADYVGLTDEQKAQLKPIVNFGDETTTLYHIPAGQYEALPEAMRSALSGLVTSPRAATDRMIAEHPDAQLTLHRRLFRTGNFEILNDHFKWVDDFAVTDEEESDWAVVFERESGGRFFGVPELYVQTRPWSSEEDIERLKQEGASVIVNEFQGKIQEMKKASELTGGESISYVVVKTWDDPKQAWEEFEKRFSDARSRVAEVKSINTHEMGAIARQQNDARLSVVAAEIHVRDVVLKMEEAQRELHDHPDSAEAKTKLDKLKKDLAAAEASVRTAKEDKVKRDAELERQSKKIRDEVEALEHKNNEHAFYVRVADGRHRLLEMSAIVRAYPANQLGFGGKLGVYTSRWGEFITADPREVNSEGGVFPAIFGTIVMTLIMSVAVVPFGVLAALYLREYAKGGPVVSAIRIAVNNLAGVPSIVFGVFGMGFFIYVVGGYIDGGPKHGLGITPMDGMKWLLGLLLVIIMVFVAVYLGWKGGASKARGYYARAKLMGYITALLWVSAVGAAVALVLWTPFFDGFYRVRLEANDPTFRKGALIWCSLTLALLTLPVVIVATEEALAAVPRSMREGSYACGASKWQTIKRIVLPRAMPGIMTGMILAMARGAGEVAPLMLVGVKKTALEPPVDLSFPFVHADRSIMHLGFHIRDVGVQSHNGKAAVPLVFTTTLLLILIIVVLNLLAIWLRARLRRKFVSGHF